MVRQGTLTPSSAGSSPAIPATDDKDGPPSFLYASLAQSAEHLPFKQGVRGSNPRRGTTKIPVTATVTGIFLFPPKHVCKQRVSNVTRSQQRALPAAVLPLRWDRRCPAHALDQILCLALITAVPAHRIPLAPIRAASVVGGARGRQTCGQPQNPISNARLFLRSRG